MNNSNNIISSQPIVSYLDKTTKQKNDININPHKNACEKCCTCNSTAERCPINCSEFIDTLVVDEDREFGGSYKSFGMYSCCCLPVSLPTSLIFCGSCTLYNIARNKCDNNDPYKNYVC